jgi:hypothetical protein
MIRSITKRWRTLLVLLIGAGLCYGGWRLYLQWLFPYGQSHSCDKQLMQALVNYAEEHNGAFPAGEATPEASLSLLYPEYANEYVLQGKTVPLDLVKVILERGERLGPDTCGWHYVEGLRTDDDHRLALFWDKAGLGHNGERNRHGGRLVFFVGLGTEYIPADKWQLFLDEQQALLAGRNKR